LEYKVTAFPKFVYTNIIAKRIACWAIFMMLVLPLSLAAEERAGDQALSLNLGVSIPTSDIDLGSAGGGKSKAGAPGFAGGAQYLYNAAPNLGVGLDINYIGTGRESSSDILAPGITDTYFQSLVLMAIARANLSTRNPVPYFIGGLGFHSTTLHLDTAPGPGLVWADTHTTETRAIVNDTHQGFAGALGFGMDYYVTPQTFLGAEMRFQVLGSATYKTTPFGANSTGISNIDGTMTSFNIMFHGGYKFSFGEANSLAAQATPVGAAPVVVAPVMTPAESDRQQTRTFIISGYRSLIDDLSKGSGSHLTTLLDLLHIASAQRPDAVLKIKALSVAYPNISDFADRVVEKYQASASSSSVAPTVPTKSVPAHQTSGTDEGTM
jgi:hypothetical protein